MIEAFTPPGMGLGNRSTATIPVASLIARGAHLPPRTKVMLPISGDA
jgi:hypothetical protein